MGGDGRGARGANKVRLGSQIWRDGELLAKLWEKIKEIHPAVTQEMFMKWDRQAQLDALRAADREIGENPIWGDKPWRVLR